MTLGQCFPILFAHYRGKITLHPPRLLYSSFLKVKSGYRGGDIATHLIPFCYPKPVFLCLIVHFKKFLPRTISSVFTVFTYITSK